MAHVDPESQIVELRAKLLDTGAAHLRLRAAALRASNSFRVLGRQVIAGERRIVSGHPDLQELDLQMEGFYGEGLT